MRQLKSLFELGTADARPNPTVHGCLSQLSLKNLTIPLLSILKFEMRSYFYPEKSPMNAIQVCNCQIYLLDNIMFKKEFVSFFEFILKKIIGPLIPGNNSY